MGARVLPEVRSTEQPRPAFYALTPGGWRDLVTLLHPPYTAWNLSYVALGAAAAPRVHADRLGAALSASLLAVGVAAHALDELDGRPLKTKLSNRSLVLLAVVSMAGALGIGIAGIAVVSPLLAPLVIIGGALVPAYNLELAGGREILVALDRGQRRALQLGLLGGRPARRLILELGDERRVGGDDQPQAGHEVGSWPSTPVAGGGCLARRP